MELNEQQQKQLDYYDLAVRAAGEGLITQSEFEAIARTTRLVLELPETIKAGE